MARIRITPTTPNLLRHRAAIESFKVCPLCTSLNVRENGECFVCRWHGDFDLNPASIEMTLYELLQRCPDLPEVILPSPEPSLWRRLIARLPWRRRSSIRAIDVRV